MKPFTFAGQVPPGADDIPGVWQNKRGSGWRVPWNAHGILGMPLPNRIRPLVEAEVVERALVHPLLRDGLPEFVKPHQKTMIQKSLSLPGTHGWAPPGAGKTLTALVVLAAQVGPRLVITKAAARGTWMEQCKQYTRMEPRLLLGQTPPDDLPNDKEALYITAWETLKYWKKALVTLNPFVVVLDEIHWLRRPKHTKATVMEDGSIRFDGLGNSLDAIRAICASAQWHMGLTATPIPGRVRDLWTQLDMCEPWQWGSFHQFGMRYCGGEHNGYGYQYTGLTNAEELRDRLSFVKVRVARDEVSKHLPKKRREIIRLSVQEQNKPAAMRREIKKAAKSGDTDSYFEALLMEAASRKHAYIEDRVLTSLQAGQKVVVFTGRRLDCERLADKLQRFLTMRVPRAEVWWAHGGTEPSDRDKIRHKYMASPGPALLIGTGDAWGESIDLQDTDLALITMLPWTPDKIIQWEGRFSRLGQKRPVLISYVVARATADEHITDLLLDKLPHVGEIAEDEAALEIENALGGVETGAEAQKELLSRVSAMAPPL